MFDFVENKLALGSVVVAATSIPFFVLKIKWAFIEDQLMRQNAQCPRIHKAWVVRYVSQHLGRNIKWRATERLSLFIVVINGPTKIANLYSISCRKDEVLLLQIAVGDFRRAQILQGRRHLSKIEPSAFQRNNSILYCMNVVVQVSQASIIHDHIHIFGVIIVAMEAGDVEVSQAKEGRKELVSE